MRRGARGILPLRGTRLAQAHEQMFLLVSIVDANELSPGKDWRFEWIRESGSMSE